MPRVTLNQTSFAGGEISPRAMGRTDIDRYGTALKKARNCHPVITGGLKMREGSLHVATATGVNPRASVLIPFILGRDQAWQLEFSENLVTVYNDDGTAAGVTMVSPYIAGAVVEVEYAQSGSTMWLFHKDSPIQRIQRFASGVWVLSPAPFTTLPFAETGLIGAGFLAISLTTVGVGRTVTGPAGTFLASDVGRGLLETNGSGIAVITGYTSATQVTVEVTRAFSSALFALWSMQGSPQTQVTASAKDPLGATITLTAVADAWRSTDVGAMVRLNGGLCKITSLTSALIANAKIIRELTSTVAAPSLAWSIEYAVWGPAVGYPRTGTVHQQRLIAAGTSLYPLTVWGSRLAEPLDFELGTTDDLAFSFTIDSDQASAISYVTSARDLVVLTESGEFSMRSGIEKPITPTNVRVVPEKNHGCAQIRPVQIGDETMFVQRAGRKIRSIGWRYEFDSYKAPDITALAEHLTTSGVQWMAYQQEPDLMLWVVRADGKFMTCTIDRDQQPSVIGWALHETDGIVECVSAIPNGDREQVWAIVRRTINGATVRLIERFDGTFEPMHPSVTTDGPVYGCTVDCGVVVDNPAGQTAFTVAHLANTGVTVVADGSPMGTFTTDGTGALTLPRASKRTLIGLPFRSEGTLLTPELGTGEGSAQGNAARTAELSMRFLETIGAKVVDSEGGEQTVPFRRFGPDILDAAPEPYTGLLRISKLGWDRGVAEVSVVQDQPLPWHLLGVIRKHTVNG